jgi:hypothetical protein
MISDSPFSKWYINYTVRNRMGKNEREVTYAKFQHVSTRGRKEKRSHIKFLLLLLNLTPIINTKIATADLALYQNSKAPNENLGFYYKTRSRIQTA